MRSQPTAVAAALSAAALATLLAGPGGLCAPGPAAAAGATPAAEARAGGEPFSPLLLVPPEDRFGRPRIEALAADPEIDRVVFFLDGDELGTDDRRPYRMKIDLGRARSAPATTRSIRAVAYDRDGSVVGEDLLELVASGGDLRPAPASGAAAGGPLAPRAGLFDVAIREVRGNAAAGSVELVIRVSVPSDGRLRDVQVFRNDRLAARLPPPAGSASTGGGTTELRTRLDTPDARPSDYLRVLARLEDGRALEDARPLVGTVSAERLDVCLVDLFVVVTNRWGEPVRGLGREDFRVRLHGRDGRQVPVTRFREASEVPLALGLLVDSSESMRLIMDETKEAAQRFLERTLVPGDEAFLVDVDTVPRLVHAMSPSPAELAAAFADLEPGGTTALYDAILLGLLRLERHPGRRALVVLTDGRDFGSDFGPRRCRRHATGAGVPVYVLSLAGMPGDRTSPERNFRLEALARATGGRVLPVQSLEGIDRAYREIDRELRSQYVLGLSSDRVLTAEELDAIEVQVTRPGLQVRAARSVSR